MMHRNIFTRRGRTLRAILGVVYAATLVAGGVVLMLAYFDVLTK